MKTKSFMVVTALACCLQAIGEVPAEIEQPKKSTCTPGDECDASSEVLPASGVEMERKVKIETHPEPTEEEQSQSPEFKVKTLTTRRPPPPHAIQLVAPPHKSTLTAGIVTFTWQLPKLPKGKKLKKLQLVIEKMNRQRNVPLSAKETLRKFYLGPGQYRWRIATSSSKIDSRWRIFKVIELKSQVGNRSRGLSSQNKPPDSIIVKIEDGPAIPKAPPKGKASAADQSLLDESD